MNGKKSAFFAIGFVVIIILISILIPKLKKDKNTVSQNEANFVGSTAGNIYNGGYYIETDNLIYFANFLDGNYLYSMDKSLRNFKKISSTSVCSLNCDNENLYFAKTNYKNSSVAGASFDFSSTGIYRYNFKKGTLIRMYDGVVLYSVLVGNNVYYQEYLSESLKLTFNTMTTNCKDKTLLVDENFIPASFYEGNLYYSGRDVNHNLYSYNLSSGTSKMILEGNTLYPVATNSGIYYIDLANGYKLTKLPLSGGEPAVIIDSRVTCYNISLDGTTIFYQDETANNHGFYSYNISSGEKKLILSGDFNSINVTSDYVFYNSFDSTQIYCYKINQGRNISFTPSVEK